MAKPAYTWFNNGDYGTPDYGAPEYGALYNWYTIDTLSNGNKNLCPVGWHVPSDIDWTILTTFLGGESVAGSKMKETGLAHWNYQDEGSTNESGFTGLPGGWRLESGNYTNFGIIGAWWSTSSNSTFAAWGRLVQEGNVFVTRFSELKGLGLSIRCLRD